MLRKNWRATCFATLLQKELNSDVARIATHVRTYISTSKVTRFVFVDRGGKTRNIAIQLVLQRSYKTICNFLVPVIPYLYWPLIQFRFENTYYYIIMSTLWWRGRGGGGIEDSFIRVGSTPRSSPLLQPFMIEKAPLTFHWKIVPLFAYLPWNAASLFSSSNWAEKKYALKFRRGCKIYRKCNPHSWFRSLFEVFAQIVKFKVRKRE